MIAYYEDVVIGEERLLGSHEFTREGIVAFARQYDPQRFHVDEEAAKSSMFGGLCASGWHTAAAAMRAIVDYRARARAEQAALGRPLPLLGVSPGVENLRWPNPVRPGDVVTFHARVVDKRETKRPEWGLVFSHTWGVNQHGEPKLAMDTRAFVARRPS